MASIYNEVRNVVGHSLYAADSRSDDNANPGLVDFLKVNSSIRNSLVCSDYRKLAVAVHLAGFFPVYILERIKVLDLAGKSGVEFGCIEPCDRGCTAYSGIKCVEILFNGLAQGIDSAKSGNDDSPLFHNILFLDYQKKGETRSCYASRFPLNRLLELISSEPQYI